MLLNYLKLSLRLLVRNPFFTVINVVGLSVGYASFFVLWQYSTSELNADQYHKDSDHIARIGVNWRWTDDGGKTWGQLIFGFANSNIPPKLTEDFPEIESTLRILNQSFFDSNLVNHSNKIVISLDDQKEHQRIFKEEKVAYADSNLFSFFYIPLIYGQSNNVLNQANNVVLSKTTAIKYFGKKDPTGELLKLNDTTTLKVSGVYEDLPPYTHLNFELVISNVGVVNKWNTAGFGMTICYVKLNQGDFKNFETALSRKTNEYWAGILRGSTTLKIDMFIQPLEEIPFSQNFFGDGFYPKSKPFLITLAFVALSVLLMAWINYVNLSVRRTSHRFKEIATRKVSGAGTTDIIGQFVIEALVTNVVGLALSFTLIQISRATVSVLFDIHIADYSSISLSSAVVFASIVLTGILLTGLYPAVISMTYQPRALFNLRASGSGKRFIPSLLTVSQLAAAIILILLGFTVSLQLNHILTMDVGIKKDQVVVIEAPVVKPLNYTTILSSLKKEILANSSVSVVTCSRFLVNNINEGHFDSKRIGADLTFGMDNNFVDEDFISLYGIKLLAGRSFVKDNRPDGVVISRYAATRLGFSSPDDAVGSEISISAGGENRKIAEVIGVFEDFRNISFLNMSQSVSQATDQGRGMVLIYRDQLLDESRSAPETISVRVSAIGFEESMKKIKNLYERQFPGNVFTWYFLNDKWNEVYTHEKVARNQIILFTGLALFIACLGLLGMISNKVVEKTKEIGIRKVLGAELHQIAQLLLNTTVKQIVVAIIIGTPVAYYLSLQYLERFSERIILQWWHFTLPIAILIAILFATIASVLWKAARNNPVEALKYE